jgi:hypothetical protein
VNQAIKVIHDSRRRGLVPLLCATGGFKAEIAFLNLLGALMQVEVCYIHEHFREVIRLPQLPLRWDPAVVLLHRDFFEWIDAEPRLSHEVENWLRGRPELRPLVVEGEDGYAYLGAAGDLLFKVAQEELLAGPRATWPAVSSPAPREKVNLSGVEHHRPRGWENFVDRLAVIDCVTQLRYDAVACGGDRVRVLDGASGDIAVRYEQGGKSLPLVVSTTARGTAQTELVAEYFRRHLS